MSSLSITKWESVNPLSPGWMTLPELVSVLNNPSSIPAEFFDANVITEYVDILFALQDAAQQSVGFENYGISALADLKRYSVVVFDTAVNGLAYEDARSLTPEWVVYLDARAALLDLLDVAITIYPPVERDVSAVNFDTLTNAEIESWMV